MIAAAESTLSSTKDLPVFRAAGLLPIDPKVRDGIKTTGSVPAGVAVQDELKVTEPPPGNLEPQEGTKRMEAQPAVQRHLDGMKAVTPHLVQSQTAQEGDRESRPAGKLSEELLSTAQSAGNKLAQTEKAAEKAETPRQLPAQEFNKILNRAQFGQANGTSKLLLRLNPGNLGMIRVEIIQREGVSTIQLLASTAHGKELLDSSLTQLKQAFVQQNLTVDRVEIAQALQDASGKNRQQQSSSEQEPQDRQGHTEEQETEFKEFLLDMEV